MFQQALQFGGAEEESEEQEVGTKPHDERSGSKGSGLFPHLAMLLAQVKWADLKDQMTLDQRVSGSSTERPTTLEPHGENESEPLRT